MAKAPAFQFYPGDARRDAELHMMTFQSRGVWWEMLCCMWDARERGKLEGSREQLCRLLGCTCEELERAVTELSVTKTADVTFCNDVVTVINRRMYREDRSRLKAKERVKRHREKLSGNADITDASSSSSSSLKDSSKEQGFTLPKLDEIINSAPPKIKTDLEKVCYELYKSKKFSEVYAFTNKALKNKKNPRAILHALGRCVVTDMKGSPFAFCTKILEVENGNYNEKDTLR